LKPFFAILYFRVFHTIYYDVERSNIQSHVRRDSLARDAREQSNGMNILAGSRPRRPKPATAKVNPAVVIIERKQSCCRPYRPLTSLLTASKLKVTMSAPGTKKIDLSIPFESITTRECHF